MPQRLIGIEGLSKKFSRQGARTGDHGLRDIARALLAQPASRTLRPGEFWSLDDVSLELRAGEALAVLGGNGAGKSTLLKIIAGLLKPDAGEVSVSGAVSSLLDLGANLEPLLTGRENIEQAAALHGLGAKQVGVFLERVLSFAELSEFADARLQTYSTGMRARLGYAIGTQIRPDILLVDEVLAVGDMAFQRKCIDHMRRFLAEGGGLILVSHNPYQTQAVCSRGIVLDRGRLAFAGTAIDAVHHVVKPAPGTRYAADPQIGAVRIADYSFAAESGGPLHHGASCRLRLSCHAEEPLDILWGFSIWSEDGWVCVTTAYDLEPRQVPPGDFELTCRLPHLSLAGGVYLVRATVIDRSTSQLLATMGHVGGGAPVEVLTEPSLVTNAQLAQRQLVEIDVEWQ